MTTKQQSLFTITKASEYLNVSRQTIYNWIQTGAIYTIEVGGVRFIPLEAIKKAKK